MSYKKRKKQKQKVYKPFFRKSNTMVKTEKQKIRKYKRLVVTSSEEVFYCHNKKCGLCNHMWGCWGYEEGDKPLCDNCKKPVYTEPNEKLKHGDISTVDI